MTPIPLPIPPLIAAAEAASHGTKAWILPFPLLISLTALTFLGTLVFSRLAIQLRLPAVLGVLALGLLLHHNQRVLSLEQVENLHVVSLSMLLFCAGLNAELHHLRGFLRYGVLLAVGGVLLTTLVFGGLLWGIYAGLAAFWPGLGIGALPVPVALMAAACLSCTDAMASLEVLRRAGLQLPQRLRALVEMESSLNAPLAILVVLLVMALAGAGWLQPQSGGDPYALLFAVQSFFKSIGSGVMVGLILSFSAQFILRRFLSSSSQILLLGIAVALSSYGLAELLHGSGFISAYVTGLFLANDIYANRWITPERLEHSLEPFNTLTEFSVFLLFGTLISPASIVAGLLPGVLSALALILIARPLSVLALQPFSPFGGREGLLLAWFGLRGAVPLALAYTAIHALQTLPGLGEERALVLEHQLEGLIFLVVVTNLVVQGLSLPPLCRRLGLAEAN
jgi:cell volume regulation protein A